MHRSFHFYFCQKKLNLRIGSLFSSTTEREVNLTVLFLLCQIHSITAKTVSSIMGNEASKEERQEKKIFQSPQVGEASDLYWACRSGDVDAVKQVLATTKYTDLNRLEPNGSTALHAASFFGHADIVRLLLQKRGVMRHRKNRHGSTAYEEAANDEIRQLFHRLGSNRFCEDSTNENERIFRLNDVENNNEDDENDEDNEAPDGWVGGAHGDDDVIGTIWIMKVMKTMFPSPILRSIYFYLENRQKGDSENLISFATFADELQALIKSSIPSDHPEFEKAYDLFFKYSKTKKAEHLLRLYTLETPFYRSLTPDNSGWMLCLCLFDAGCLRNRAFSGRSYRGLSMTEADLKAYQWALKRKGSILYTNTYCSTSVDETVAKEFMGSVCSEKVRVLMVFHFPEPCDAAIQLYAVSEKLPCISEYENEQEVLVLPGSIFHVVNITNDDAENLYTIYLENVLPKWNPKALRDACRDGK